MTTSKRVYIAYTGGTIGMARRADGTYAPQPGYLSQLMAAMPELHGPAMPAYTITEYDPLLDSANMTPANWSQIASDIQQHYADYDGFVILHGTDTMAYSASALAFMLRGLSKPVIFTGSQIPLFEVRSDARTNLVTSLLIAAYHSLPEVGLCFGGTLLRGCRATKVHTSGFTAFLSPNCPPLATMGIDITINRALLRGAFPADTPLSVQVIDPALRVAALRLFPGMSGAMLGAVLDEVQGLVIEAFGAGNGPDHDADFLAAISRATGQGKVIVVCTQCLYGGADLARYATGSSLARAGAISGYDMTAEAALTKLLMLFSAGHPPAEVRRLMGVDLRGELTIPSS
jgi:L-asparaginase